MAGEYIWMGSEEEAERYAATAGHWIVANINQQIGWPAKKTLVRFSDLTILFLSELDDQYPAVAVLREGNLTDDEIRRRIMFFLSSLAWSKGRAIKVVHWTGGGRPYRLGHTGFKSSQSLHFRITYLPEPQDRNARLALAFYREAMGLDHEAYSFLSFYKVINLRYKKGDKQKAWISSALPKVDGREAKNRLEELLKQEVDISDYLYNSCRCAIAHAGVDPTVDPDDFEDIKRLQADLPLIRNLVEILIEEEYGIKRSSSIWREHLYELSGFKKIFGAELSSKLKGGGSEFPNNIVIPKTLSIRLGDENHFSALEKLTPEVRQAVGGIVILGARSENGVVNASLILNFLEERLVFDPVNGLQIQDDGSVLAAEQAADVQRFLGCYWGNGALEVWDPQSNECLGRRDPFIPTNVDLGATIESFRQAEARCIGVANQRKLDEAKKT